MFLKTQQLLEENANKIAAFCWLSFTKEGRGAARVSLTVLKKEAILTLLWTPQQTATGRTRDYINTYDPNTEAIAIISGNPGVIVKFSCNPSPQECFNLFRGKMTDDNIVRWNLKAERGE